MLVLLLSTLLCGYVITIAVRGKNAILDKEEKKKNSSLTSRTLQLAFAVMKRSTKPCDCHESHAPVVSQPSKQLDSSITHDTIFVRILVALFFFFFVQGSKHVGIYNFWVPWAFLFPFYFCLFVYLSPVTFDCKGRTLCGLFKASDSKTDDVAKRLLLWCKPTRLTTLVARGKNGVIIGSAEALPILCMRCAR